MKKTRICLLVLAVMVGGCAGSPAQTLEQAKKHTKAMVELKPGMSPEEVIKLMGNPYKTDTYRGTNGEPILVYFYSTEGKDLPLVFQENKLAGWGWRYLDSGIIAIEDI